MPNYIYDILDIPSSIYDEAIAAVCNKFSADNRIKYIGLYGHINDPGISDLDMVFVTSKGMVNSVAKDFAAIKNDLAHGDFLFWHNPVIAGEDQLELLKKFHSLIGLKSLYGNILNDCFNENKAQKLIHAIIWTSHTRQYCSDFLNSNDNISMRYALLAIKCCYISAASYLQYLDKNIRADKMRDTAKHMREEFKQIKDDCSRSEFLTGEAKKADKILHDIEWELQDRLKQTHPDLPLIGRNGEIFLKKSRLSHSTEKQQQHTIPSFYASAHLLINQAIISGPVCCYYSSDDFSQAIFQWLDAARIAYLQAHKFRHMGGYYILFDHLPSITEMKYFFSRFKGNIELLLGR